MPIVSSRNPSVAGGDWLGWASQAVTVAFKSSTAYILDLGDGTRLDLRGSDLAGEGPGPTAGTVTGFTWRGTDGNVLVEGSAFVIDAGALAGWSATSIQAAFTALRQGSITFTGHEGADRLTGGAADDQLRGFAGNDALAGGEGADTLSGGTGSDTLVGGAGNDSFLFDEPGGSDLRGEAAIHGSGADGSGHPSEVDSLLLEGAAAYDLRGIAITQIDRIAVRDDEPSSLHLSASQFGTRLVGNALRLDGAAGSSIDLSVTVDVSTAAAFTAAGWTLGTGGVLRLGVNGSAGVDTLTGSSFDDTIRGGGGADRIVAGAGADAVSLAPGRLAGTVNGGEGRDALLLDLSGLSAPIALAMLAPSATTRVGSLSFIGIEDLSVLAGSGRDTLAAFEGEDRLLGGAGNDRLLGGAGGDLLDGGADADELLGEAGRDGLNGGDGADTLDGGLGLDTLDGGGGDDTLRSGLGENRDTDGASPDPASTREHLDGGAGVDTAIVDRSTAARGIALDLGDPEFLVDLRDGTTLLNVERIVFRSGRGSDTLSGGSFADDLAGGDGRDVLSGAEGGDTLDGGAGTDGLDGGSGADLLGGGTGGDGLDGGEGDDRLSGGDGFDTLDGGLGADSLSGDAGLDWLDGGAGDDTLRGGSGADTLAGGLGNDRYEVDGTSDQVYEEAGEGRDTVQAFVDHVLSADLEILILAGNAASGGGNRGDNSLSGNSLANTLTGGGGNDSFLFRGGFGIDAVTDFTAGAGLGDRLLFDRAVFATREAALAAARQVGTDVWVAVDPDTRVVLPGLDLSRLHADDFAVI